MSKRFTNLPPFLMSALGYGSGFVIGALLIIILFNNPITVLLIRLLGQLQLLLYVLFSLFLIVVIAGLGGAAAGGIGGWVLGGLANLGERRRFMWRSAISFGVANLVMVLPVVVMTAVVGFLNSDLNNDYSKLPTLLSVYGLVYGAISGLLLGWLTVGLRQTTRVLLAAVFGFGLGGWLLGSGLFYYIRLDSPSRLVTVLFICIFVFLFGLIGGGAIGFAFQYISENRSLFPDTRNWRILRRVTLIVIALVFAFVFGKLIVALTVQPATLADTLPLSTVGSHWQGADELIADTAVPGAESSAVEAWCDESGRVNVIASGVTKQFLDPRCQNEPVAAEDGEGNLHLIWYSDEISKGTGTITPGHFLVESILTESGWSEPAIIARPAAVTQPALSTLSNGSVQLVWPDEDGLKAAVQTPYQCDDVPLTNIGQIVYSAVRQEQFHPKSDPIPFCQNRYDRLLITPNPTAPDSALSNSPHGAFDDVAELVSAAQYEVLFTTMQWDAPSDTSSPGSTMARGIAELYEKVAANPDAYPRGVTVRILLGNLPYFAAFEPVSQINHVMQDLNNAGLPELVNEELGWKVEVANFDGAWPHAHSKFVVVDGKTAMSAGFNYSYLHLSSEHPSEQGLDMTDLGLQVSGPVAQSALAAYDDLWSDSDLATCSQFPLPAPTLRFLWCDVSPAEATHTPEVLRFYPTEGDSNAFALHHTSAFHESDEALLAAIDAAEETIDLYEVNFSMETVCMFAILLVDLCNHSELATPYMDALLTAVTEHDVKTRILLEPSAFNGFENRIGISYFLGEVAQAGKLDNVEIKWFDGKMHDKAFLIDGEFLVVGSQNFHYSAWGSPSLTEYNLSTEDSNAIADFLSEFEFQWDQGTMVEE